MLNKSLCSSQNIIMSLTGVSRKKFMLATTIATTPVSIALAIMGNSLHQINAINTKNLNDILYSPNFILPFFIVPSLLSSHSLIPINTQTPGAIVLSRRPLPVNLPLI